VESLSAVSTDDVRVHYNSAEPALVDALAYARGTEIHVAPGEERHLAHEAWHVAQQKLGRVPATGVHRGLAVNDSTELESEANVMASSGGTRARTRSPAACWEPAWPWPNG
jgi:hypothetical protein